jgi:hypothetical protein
MLQVIHVYLKQVLIVKQDYHIQIKLDINYKSAL